MFIRHDFSKVCKEKRAFPIQTLYKLFPLGLVHFLEMIVYCLIVCKNNKNEQFDDVALERALSYDSSLDTDKEVTVTCEECPLELEVGPIVLSKPSTSRRTMWKTRTKSRSSD